jgi:thiol-disulfide isomerase/thioredoxin
MKTLICKLSLVMFMGALGCGEGPSSSCTSAKPEAAVELADVTFAGLDRAIADEKGKVVLVDVWSTWCDVCKQEFHHLVEMHEKFSKDGLACVSVTTDNEMHKAEALQFLKSHKAHFANYRLSETNRNISKELNDKYETDRQPILYLFNRKGDKVATLWNREERSMESLEKRVKALLDEKP